MIVMSSQAFRSLVIGAGRCRPAVALAVLLLTTTLAVGCTDKGPSPTLVRRYRDPGSDSAITGNQNFGAAQRPNPGERYVTGGEADPEENRDQPVIEQVEETVDLAALEERRSREKAERETYQAEVERLAAEIERRQKEEAEARLAARQQAAQQADERASRQAFAERERAATEAALSELETTEGLGESIESLRQRIAIRKEFLDRYRNNPATASTSRIPTTMHTLADLYVRYANEKFLQEMNEFERNERLCDEGKAGCDPNADLPLKDFSEAIALYEDLLASYPDRADNDKVLYQLSFAYQEMGRQDRAERVLTSFLEKNPEDPRSQAAWFRLGLSYAERGQGVDIFEAEPWLLKSIDAFKQALKFRKDTYYHDQSLFQLGWATFRLGKYDQTVSWMDRLTRKVIEDAKAAGDYPGFDTLYEKSTGLVREAIKFMAIAWSEMGDGRHGPENLEQFWEKAPAGDHRQHTYIALGEYYEKEERYEEAIGVYKRMIKRYPTYRAVPRVLELIVTVYEKDKRWEEVNEGRREIITRLAKGAQWWQDNEDPEAREKAVTVRSRSVFQLAQYHHAKAQQEATENPEYHFGQAAEHYKLFLQDYTDHEDAPEARYLMAEVLFSTKRFAEAAVEYERVAWESKHEKRTEEAAFKAVVSWDNALQRDLDEAKAGLEGGGQEFDRGEALKKSPYTERLIAGISRFITAYPKHEKVADLMFNQGELLFSTKQYAKARESYRAVVAAYPKDPRSLEAQRNIATTFLDEGDQVAAEQEYRRALAMVPATDVEQRKELRTLIAAAIYKQAEQKKQAGDLEGAAERFLVVPTDPELKDVKIAPNAYYDAAIAYKDAGNWDKATETFQGLAKAYPDNELAPQGLSVVGTYLRDSKKLSEAAEVFLASSRLYEQQENKEQAEELHYVAGKMYEELKDWDRTLQTMRDYVKKFGAKPKRLVEAKFIEGYAAYSREQWQQAEKIWAELLVMHEKYEKEGAEVSPRFPARSKYLLAEREYSLYEPMELRQPLQKSLKAKQAALTRVINLYAAAAAYRVEEFTTGSTYRIGSALMNFRDAILNSERPNEILGDELLLEEYGFALEEQAFPFEEKAIQTFEQNVAYSRQNQAFNEFIEKSFQALARLFPGRYAKAELGETLSCGTLDFAKSTHPQQPEPAAEEKKPANEPAPKPAPKPVPAKATQAEVSAAESGR